MRALASSIAASPVAGAAFPAEEAPHQSTGGSPVSKDPVNKTRQVAHRVSVIGYSPGGACAIAVTVVTTAADAPEAAESVCTSARFLLDLRPVKDFVLPKMCKTFPDS